MGSLVLVRHATTLASAEGVNLGQRTDAALTPDGLALAVATGSAIAAELAAMAHDRVAVVSSPAQRCRQTAAAIATALDLAAEAVAVEADLREIDYGDWEGLSAAQSLARDPQLRAAWEADPHAIRIPSGESGQDVAARAFPVLEAIERRLAADRARATVVVTHNHVVRLRLTALLGLPLAEYRRRMVADPGAYSIVTYGSDRPVVRRINVLPA